jgi:hypothetical protein
LVGNVKRSWDAECVVEPIIGIENPAIPVILCIAVKLIASGLGHVIDVPASGISKLAGIARTHHSCFLNLVLAKQKSENAGRRIVHSVN